MNFDDEEILAAARGGFLAEAREMLEQFEQCLLVMESDPGDRENLNAAFRSAHTIKGTAGLFGFEAIVAFTHEVETLMDALRAQQIALSDEILAALLRSRDQMSALLDELASGHHDPALAAAGAALGAQLRALLGRAEPVPVAPAAPQADAATAAQRWHLSLRFRTDSLRAGLDPLAFIRYLATLGEVTCVETLVQAVPAIETLDPEDCHLGFELALHSAASHDAILDVFAFAADDAEVDVVAADAPAAAFDDLLRRRCGDDAPARASLLQCWERLGLVLPRGGDAAGDAASPSSAVEHRADAQPEERRRHEPDRRTGARDRRGEEVRYLRVRADKLDRLIDLIGELVIAGSGAQMAARDAGAAGCIEAAQRVADLVQSTRDGALALRMGPVGEVFARFQRVVRDTARQLGKEIELTVTGAETELDKSMVEVVADPLMHLVRNSLDHGIESPAERLAAGKPAVGRLGMHAYHEGGAIVIEVTDDGRGLQRERIVRKAVERGLIADGASMTDAAVWQLIFAPGFSTAEQVTNLSGRGVGMDVVRRNIEALRGQITLASQEGSGTTIQVRLPLTLAMIDGFLTRVGGVHYVLPLSVVAECIDVPKECRAHEGQERGVFDLRGEVLPWLDLAVFYGAAPAGGLRRSLVVVRDGAVRMGLVVDRLLGEHQTVIKPLAGIFEPLKALSGATILGSGDVALLLDVPGLIACATQPDAPAPAAPVSRSS